MIYALLALVAVFVSARSSAEWIPDVSEISHSIVLQRPLAVGKRRLRIHDEETERSDEERAGSPPHLNPQLLAPLMKNGESSSTNPLASIIESPIPSLMKDKSVAEHLSSNVPDKDVSLLKSNIAFTDRMEELDINVDNVAAAVQTLRTTRRLPKYMYNDYTLTLMALGSEYFKQVERFGNEITPIPTRLLKPVMGEYVKSDKFKLWMADRTDSRVSSQKVYGKMRWLEEMGDFKMSDKEDLADMAFGSEFFKISKIKLTFPSPIQSEDKIETLDQLKHQIEQLAKRHDVDPKVREKLQAFAEDPGNIGKTKKELLTRAKDAVLDDKVAHLKSNKAFTQRMEELEVNIDDVKVATQRLRKQPGLLKYDDYSLYLMVLGSAYFEQVESSVGNIKSMYRTEFDGALGTYAVSTEYENWSAERKYSLGKKIVAKFYGKMSSLKLDKHLKVLKDVDLANMAFGSEFFPAYKISLALPSSSKGVAKSKSHDQLKHRIEQLTNRHDVDPTVRDKLRAFAEDPGYIGKTEEELLTRAKDAVFDDEVAHLKSNRAFTQRLETSGINIDVVKVAVQNLRTTRALSNYDEYSLFLMALGSEYFKNLEKSGFKFQPILKEQLKDNMGDYIDSEDFQRWKGSHTTHLIAFKKVYAKMEWLANNEDFKLLEGKQVANMAFGSEFFSAFKIDLDLPSTRSETFDQLKHQIEQLTKRHDVDPKVRDKLRAFDEDPGFIGKTEKELLTRAKDAVLDGEVAHLKSNKAFTQRMEELEINIDDVKVAVQRLREEPGLFKYDDYSLYLMALGRKYFIKIESDGVNIKPIRKSKLKSKLVAATSSQSEANKFLQYLESDEYQRWKSAHQNYPVKFENVYAKMLRLEEDQLLKLLDGKELLNMAFGSEFFKMSRIDLTSPIKDGDKIETLDQLHRLINQLPDESNEEPVKLKEKLKNILKDDPKTFIGQTAEQLKRKANHEAIAVALEKETNKRAKSHEN